MQLSPWVYFFIFVLPFTTSSFAPWSSEDPNVSGIGTTIGRDTYSNRVISNAPNMTATSTFLLRPYGYSYCLSHTHANQTRSVFGLKRCSSSNPQLRFTSLIDTQKRDMAYADRFMGIMLGDSPSCITTCSKSPTGIGVHQCGASSIQWHPMRIDDQNDSNESDTTYDITMPEMIRFTRPGGCLRSFTNQDRYGEIQLDLGDCKQGSSVFEVIPITRLDH